jgi:hypothetical protein
VVQRAARRHDADQRLPGSPCRYDAPSHGGSTSGGFLTGASGATTPYDASASGGSGPVYHTCHRRVGRPRGRLTGPMGPFHGPHAASSGSFPRQNVPTGWAHETGTHRRWTDVPAPQAWSNAQPSLNGQAHPLVPTSRRLPVAVVVARALHAITAVAVATAPVVAVAATAVPATVAVARANVGAFRGALAAADVVAGPASGRGRRAAESAEDPR